MDDNDFLLRKFEREVLDVHHRTLSLYGRPKNIAFHALLAAFDSNLVVYAALDGLSATEAVGTMQFMKAMHEAINPALRWILEKEGPLDPVPPFTGSILEEAGQFLVHATFYVTVATFHVLYSRKLASVQVDETTRTVRFIVLPFPSGNKPWHGLAERAMIERKLSHSRTTKRNRLLQEFDEYVGKLSYKLEDGRIQLHDVRNLLASPVSSLTEYATYRELLAVPPDTELGGFTLENLRHFWRGLTTWSAACCRLFLILVSEGRAQEECIPTQVLTRAEFLNNMNILSGLDKQIIGAIVQRLAYRTESNTKNDIFLQPLLCGNNYICWSPVVVGLSKIERNILKLLSRDPSMQDLAATMIGSREKTMLREIGAILAKRGGYDFKLNKTLQYMGRKGELDLLAYNRKYPNQILLMEAKAVLAVDDISEVVAASKELCRAQEQIRSTAELLKSIPVKQKQALYPFVQWDMVTSYYLMVVTPDTHPDSQQYDYEEVPLITLETMKSQVNNKQLQSPRSFYEASQKRIWLDGLIPATDFYETIEIGGIKYEIPGEGEVG